MKSLAKPRYTQEQYEQASAVYMYWCRDQAWREGRATPSKQARLPLLRPAYGRMVAGVSKAISMHLGISVHLIRLIFIIATFFFGSGAITYIFLWITVPVGDPVQRAYAIAGSQSVSDAPLSRGNAGSAQSGGIPSPATGNAADTATSGGNPSSSESLEQMLRQAPKPALLALSGLAALAICGIMLAGGMPGSLVLPLLLGMVGIGVSWLRFNAEEGQLWTMLGGIALIFSAYAIYVAAHVHMVESVRHATADLLFAGLAMLVGVLLAIVPWIMALIRDLGTERALKEREEERADMTAICMTAYCRRWR